jgi:hypothetical protein
MISYLNTPWGGGGWRNDIGKSTCFPIRNCHIHNNGRHSRGSRLHSSRTETSRPVKSRNCYQVLFTLGKTM